MSDLNYSQLLQNLSNAILNEKDPAQKATLRKQHKELTVKLKALVDQSVAEDNEQYRAVIVSLENANKMLSGSSRSAQQTAQTIAFLSDALDILGSVL